MKLSCLYVKNKKKTTSQIVTVSFRQFSFTISFLLFISRILVYLSFSCFSDYSNYDNNNYYNHLFGTSWIILNTYNNNDTIKITKNRVILFFIIIFKQRNIKRTTSVKYLLTRSQQKINVISKTVPGFKLLLSFPS